MKYYLAIDIGASSGRHIIGWEENGALRNQEIYRFENKLVKRDNHLTWDIHALLRGVKEGIRLAFKAFGALQSLSIDTWGVDYVLLNGDREILPCYAYRDHRTEAIIDSVHAKLPFSELYQRTGCQFQTFTTVYQLYCDLHAGRLAKATDFLMMPEYLMYKLTGVKKKEYTHGTTTGLVNVRTGEFDKELIDAFSFPRRLFPKLLQPGTYLGRLLPEVASEVGGNCSVVFCATHDTASAVEGIPMEGNYPYISSGTWSLLGVKTEHALTDRKSENSNYSNEGGVGYNRYQKNIMGLWIVNSLRQELCPDKPFSEIVEEAEKSDFDETVDVNNERFFSPSGMRQAFDLTLKQLPKTPADYFRCAYRSLALGYKNALDELEENTGKRYDRLYIVGGGAKNNFLNRLTAEFTEKEIVALPIEATAIGNLLVQVRLDRKG
ncbi:MAG: rhamnulokinase [Oscillospiraceae bacterium]|nr:rhamnulokinase [Oscillospiraceae bacterium]